MKISSQVLLGVADLPNSPALYALYGGMGRHSYVAYVGIADSLKRRIAQHLLKRDSSVTTGTSAAGLNADYVTSLQWWEHLQFSKRAALEAAEMVAFDRLDPVLRSRRPDSRAALTLYKDQQFKSEIETLLKSRSSGELRLPSLEDIARRLSKLEQRIKSLEERMDCQGH
jgi:hypothetical protein